MISQLHWRSRVQAMCSLLTLQWPTALTVFHQRLITQYLGGYAEEKLGISKTELLALGRQNPEDRSEPFNMAYLGVRGCGSVNGVSRLHGRVSRHMFEPLFSRWPKLEIPVGYVTNGVHIPTWDAGSQDLWAQTCGKDCWLGTTENMADDIRQVSDDALWAFRTASSRLLVNYARKRLRDQLAANGAPAEELEKANYLFDPNTLTLGFARRFAKYKRPNLLLRDPERLIRLLTNPQRPLQLIIAGKAHPADKAGCAMIQEWTQFIKRPEVRQHVIFISDYDMLLTKHLVQGVDVWLNTPRRPWEACGTSGMKVLVNGGINLSVRDGWWDEAYTPEVGWSLDDGQEHGDDPAWDMRDAEILYDLLENEVIPEFYARDEQGIPTAWVARMRESMAQLTPHYSSNRAVREYTEQHYLPAAAAYRARAADKGAMGVELMNWRTSLAQHWNAMHFGEMKQDTENDQHIFEVQVYLDDMDPKAVQVELLQMASTAIHPSELL